MSKFTQQQIDKIFSTDSIKERKQLENDLSKRVTEIFDYILAQIDYWWDWDGVDNPTLKPYNFIQDNFYYHIEYDYLVDYDVGYFIFNNKEKNIFEQEFPVEWLWTDNEKIKECFDQYVEYKIEKLQSKKDRKKEIAELRNKYLESAKSKLSIEEQWAVGIIKKLPKCLRKK